MIDVQLRDDVVRPIEFLDIVTKSEPSRRLMEQVHRLAGCDRPLLLEGESGTGKSRLARYIHQVSRRSAKPMQTVLLSTLDDSIASSDLFGHVAGSFTDARRTRPGHFVSSNGGTLFLDEIGKASRLVQGKLLHAIEYLEITPVGADRPTRIDTRLIAATNIPLETLVERGEFLPDLEARFGHFRLRLPSLRERRADIPLLIAACIRRHYPSFGYVAPPSVCPELEEVLRDAPWPMNLRELDSAIEYLLMSAMEAPVLTLKHCTGPLAPLVKGSQRRRETATPERTREIVAQTGGKSQAARELGVARSTVIRRLKRLDARRENTGDGS